MFDRASLAAVRLADRLSLGLEMSRSTSAVSFTRSSDAEAV